VQTHEVSSGKRPVGKMTRFSFLPNSAKLTSVVRQSGKSRMTVLDFTEQNHVVLDFSGNVPSISKLVTEEDWTIDISNEILELV
jgi:hypothetical protein